MKQIDTLISDIYAQLLLKDNWMTEELSHDFAHDVAARLRGQFAEQTKPTLRLSQMGPRCPKALWHSIHTPGEAEKLPASAINKFSFGHIVEAWAITLAKAAGHRVEGEQDEIYLDGVRGHRDCVIDGCLVDVKSSASFSFKKFADGSIRDADTFGYLDQLDAYMVGSSGDPIVQVKDKAYLLVVDKQLGKMVLYEHTVREDHIRSRVREYKRIAQLSTPPECTCGVQPFGKSGNIQLDTKASYNVFKYSCFPNLRKFIYADGPVYLTQVVRKPDVIEVDRLGNIVHER